MFFVQVVILTMSAKFVEVIDKDLMAGDSLFIGMRNTVSATNFIPWVMTIRLSLCTPCPITRVI